MQGKLEDARGLSEKVLEVRKRTIEEAHPDTLRDMKVLAVVYEDLGHIITDKPLEAHLVEYY